MEFLRTYMYHMNLYEFKLRILSVWFFSVLKAEKADIQLIIIELNCFVIIRICSVFS